MKLCTKCGTSKPPTEFYDPERRAECKVCSLARRAAYREANRDQINREKRQYHKTHPHLKWRYRYEERMREAGMLPLVEDFTREDVVSRYGDACWHCGGDFRELDHFPVPVSEGGMHTLGNVRPSCILCNRRSWRVGTARTA